MMYEPQNPFNVNGANNENPSPNATPSGGFGPQYSSTGNSQGLHDTNLSNQPSSLNDAKPTQPEYGQVKVPEYGAMASQFPANYDPYLYGKPEEKPRNQNQQNQQNPQMNPQGGQYNPQMGGGYGYGLGPNQSNQGNIPYGGPNQMPGNYDNNPNNQYGQPYNNGQPYKNGPFMPGASGTPGYQPDMRNGIDMNDPVQNPLKGHWDPMAILSIILLFMPIAFLPAITGAVSMWRTRKYHMKGFWVATVCMVFGVILTVAEFWLFSKGINLNDFSQQLMNQYGSGSGGSGSDGSMSA